MLTDNTLGGAQHCRLCLITLLNVLLVRIRTELETSPQKAFPYIEKLLNVIDEQCKTRSRITVVALRKTVMNKSGVLIKNGRVSGLINIKSSRLVVVWLEEDQGKHGVK